MKIDVKRFIYSVALMLFILFVFPLILDSIFGTGEGHSHSVEIPSHVVPHSYKTYICYICIKFFMVLNFKVERLFVGR